MQRRAISAQSGRQLRKRFLSISSTTPCELRESEGGVWAEGEGSGIGGQRKWYCRAPTQGWREQVGQEKGGGVGGGAGEVIEEK